MKKILLFLLLFISINSFAQTPPKKILFVGNSFFGYNNLPYRFYLLAASLGDTIVQDVNWEGGYSMKLHSENHTTEKKINQMKWDYVILEEASDEASMNANYVDT